MNKFLYDTYFSYWAELSHIHQHKRYNLEHDENFNLSDSKKLL